MKKFLLRSLLVFMLFGTFAFTYVKQTLPDPVFKIMEVVFLYPLLHGNYHYSQEMVERDKTSLETGLRANYGMARNYAQLNMVEQAFGQRVFLSGPHRGDMNWESPRSFGHYNPTFLNSLHQTLEQIFANGFYKEMAETVYDEYLGKMLLVYGEAYDYLDNNPELKQQLISEYTQYLEDPNYQLPSGFYDHSYDFAKQNPEFNDYDAFTAPYFWIRRMIDGTDDEFVKIFQLIYDELD